MSNAMRTSTGNGAPDLPLSLIDSYDHRPTTDAPAAEPPSATARQYTFTRRIWSMDEQRVLASAGHPTTMANVWAREMATFSRLRLNRNSMPRGDASPLEAHMEKITTAASCPWNLSTVPARN